jgi:hypothetical protein
MIDLRLSDLPNAVKVDGKSFSIHTDFRVWISFADLIQKGESIIKTFELCLTDESILELEKYEPLSEDMVLNLYKALIDFFIDDNVTPKGSKSGEKLIDYVLDGEYIYGSFMAQYGLDLVDAEHLHWHKFKAMLLSLPSNSKIKEIMSYRGYQASTKKQEEVMRELKASWQLPYTPTVEEEKAKAEFDALFD